MTTAILNNPSQATDADLINASRRGSREAFGQIVQRYQGMIAGLIYASCGDIHRSEDLAQETFISAWKSLTGLREPSKLAAWLCQIARHRLTDHFRVQTRDSARLAQVFETSREKTQPPPETQVLSDEERDLLWRTLSEVAQPYRETLVLYYRQGQSTADVAAAMETSEEAVRQRLSRGREMLREQVAVMLEKTLPRTAPSAAFTVAVVAALPALIPQTAAAAVVGAAAKGGASASGMGLTAMLAMWLGPILGLVGGIIGTRAGLRECKTPAERRLMVRAAIIIWTFVLGAMAVLVGLFILRKHMAMSGAVFSLVLAAFWIAYCAPLFALIFRANRAHQALRHQEGVEPLPPEKIAHPYIVIAGMTNGAFLWLMILAARAGEALWAVGIVAFGVLLTIVGGRYIRRRNNDVEAMLQWSIVFTLIVGISTLTMVYWKMHAWIARGHNVSLAQARELFPLWAVMLGVGIIFVIVEVILIVRARRRPSILTQPSDAPSQLPPPTP